MLVGICDDQKLYRDELLYNCRNVFKDEKVTYECFASGEELLNSGIACDFLFLDIEMAEVDGIEVKEILEDRAAGTKIIFLTSHEERMIEAFGANVIGFLKKPLQQDAFASIVNKMKIFSNRRTVTWEDAGKQYIVFVEDIRYIEAQDKYTFVILEKEKCLVRRTLKEWEELLPEIDFCRVNRSYLVNLDLFDRTQGEIVLEEGKRIRLSRKNKVAIEEQYKRYLRKRMEAM